MDFNPQINQKGTLTKMELSIVIVSFNTEKLLKNCINSVLKVTSGIEYEIIVVDNDSSDFSVREVESLQKKYKNIKLIRNERNIGFGAANNQGIKKAKGKFILLLNSDTLVHNNLLSEMVEWMKRNSKAGIVSCSLKNPDNTIQGTGGYFPTLSRVFSWMLFLEDIPFLDTKFKLFHPMHEQSPIYKGVRLYAKKKQLDWVTGAFMLIKRQVFDNIGFFDEDYFMYTEEVDLCFRAKIFGWKVYYLPNWFITHIGGASGKAWSFVSAEFEGVKLFYKKHFPSWQYPILRMLLKIGALGRIFVFGILKGKEAANSYVKAFKMA